MKVSLKFFENISIHGIRYIFLEHMGKYARIFWSVAVLTSITGFCYNNYLLYQKLNETPDINVRTRQVFSSSIPFPAITTCSPLFAKNHLGNFFNVSAFLRGSSKDKLNLTVEEQNYLASNIHACSPDLITSLKRHVQNRTDNNIVKLLNQSSLTLKEAVINCGFKECGIDCSNMFNRVLTDKGYCYSYNLQSFNTIFNEDVISEDFHSYKRSNIRKSMFLFNKLINEKIDDSKEAFQWSLDLGYEKDHEADSVPVKAEKGKYLGFNPYLNESDTKNVCTTIGNIFSFFIHLPNEIMLPMHQEYYVEFKKKRDIVLTAKSYKADKDMRKFSPKTRGCYFEGEKKLTFFKTYTKALCEYECMTNYTLSECGCVKFSMPRSSSTPVCTVDQGECYFMSMIKWPVYKNAKDIFEATCGCLKSCNDIKYEIKYDKISSSENAMVIYNVYNLSKADAVSRLSFVFDDFQILEYEEYASYKLQNFVADLGGLLGFFLGCSILSLIEIVYFIFEICGSKMRSFCKRLDHNGNENMIINLSSKNRTNIKFIKPLKISDKNSSNPARFYPQYNE